MPRPYSASRAAFPGARNLYPQPVDGPVRETRLLRDLSHGVPTCYPLSLEPAQRPPGIVLRSLGPFFARALDDERELPARFGEALQRLRDGAPEHLLERLRQLAAHGDAAVAPGEEHVAECAAQAVRRFEGDDRLRLAGQRIESLAAVAGPPGQKAGEGE